MITKELIEYMRSEMTKGTQIANIKISLLQNGWVEKDIDEAVSAISLNMGAVPAPAPATTSAPILETKSQGQGSAKKIIGIVIAIIILVALAGTGYAYYTGYFTPLETVSSDAFKSLSNTTSSTFDTTIIIDASDLNKAGGDMLGELGNLISDKITITSKGTYDINDADSFKMNSAISLAVGSVSGSLEFIFKDNTLYGRLTKAPALSFIPVIPAEYINKWYSFEATAENAQSILPTSSIGLGPESMKNLNTEQKMEIARMTGDAHFITIIDKLETESINEVLSYHFTFGLNNQGINDYLAKLESYIKSEGKNDSFLSSFNTKDISESLEKIQNFKGEAWIGKKDHRLYKFVISFDVPTGDADEGTIKISAVSIFKDWNKPLELSAPANSVPFKSLIEQSLGEARTKGVDAQIKAIISSTRADAEVYYSEKNSYKGYCMSDPAGLIAQGKGSAIDGEFT